MIYLSILVNFSFLYPRGKSRFTAFPNTGVMNSLDIFECLVDRGSFGGCGCYMEACHTPRHRGKVGWNVTRNIVVTVIITKRGVFEWFSCRFSVFFPYPCSFGDTVIGFFGCEGYSSIYTHTNFEL